MVDVSENENKNDIQTNFNSDAWEDKILVIRDAGFTESVDLQVCNIIINFEITSDPLQMDQQIGRSFRIGQKNDVIIYNLADMPDLEGYILAYYARIELMTSNSSDVTILAGANSDGMVAAACKRCGYVELLSYEDYKQKTQNENVLLSCPNKECQDHNEKLDLIIIDNFKCSECGKRLHRSGIKEGYKCISKPKKPIFKPSFKQFDPMYSNAKYNTGTYCTSGKAGDRNMYCRKICAMKHCQSLLDKECPAVKAYLKNPNISDLDLMIICAKDCKYAKDFEKCPLKCRAGVGPEAISECMNDCPSSTCRPKPHILDFSSDSSEKKNNGQSCECPACKKGYLEKVTAKTFYAFIDSLWNNKFDRGNVFTTRLEDESSKISKIKEVLDVDEEEVQ